MRQVYKVLFGALSIRCFRRSIEHCLSRYAWIAWIAWSPFAWRHQVILSQVSINFVHTPSPLFRALEIAPTLIYHHLTAWSPGAFTFFSWDVSGVW